MKRFIGKVWYFVNAGVSNVTGFLNYHHIISDETEEKIMFKTMDNMEMAVLGLMKQEKYRRFSCVIHNK